MMGERQQWLRWSPRESSALFSVVSDVCYSVGDYDIDLL